MFIPMGHGGGYDNHVTHSYSMGHGGYGGMGGYGMGGYGMGGGYGGDMMHGYK